MNGSKILENFSKRFKVSARLKANISGRFAALNAGNEITIQLFAGSNCVRIAYTDDNGEVHKFDGYPRQIESSLMNFDLEEI